MGDNNVIEMADVNSENENAQLLQQEVPKFIKS